MTKADAGVARPFGPRRVLAPILLVRTPIFAEPLARALFPDQAMRD